MATTLAVRTPKGFYDDAEDCACDVPRKVKTTANHYWLDAENFQEGWDDIKSRAEVYVDSTGFDEYSTQVICPAARAFLRAIDKANAKVRVLPIPTT